MKLRRVLMLFTVFALVFAACGGGDDKTETNASGSGDSSSSSEPSDSSSSSDENGVPVGGFFNLEKCAKVSLAFVFYTNPVGALAGLSGDQLEEYENLYGDLEDSIPSELQDAYDTVKKANAQLKEDLADAGVEDWSQFNYAQLATDQQKMQKISDAFDKYNSSDVEAATKDLGDYVTDECKSFTAN